MTNLDMSPAQVRRQQRAWRAKKDDDRARARYRDTLPQGIQVLTEMLAGAPSPWHAEVIAARIESRREAYRYKNRARRARKTETRP